MLFASLHTCIYICLYVNMYAFTFACLPVCVCVCVHVCLYVCTCLRPLECRCACEPLFTPFTLKFKKKITIWAVLVDFPTCNLGLLWIFQRMIRMSIVILLHTIISMWKRRWRQTQPQKRPCSNRPKYLERDQEWNERCSQERLVYFTGRRHSHPPSYDIKSSHFKRSLFSMNSKWITCFTHSLRNDTVIHSHRQLMASNMHLESFD